MAGRRGRFGRRPHSSGNLTALVAQLYREKRAAEDRAMFDAWENGGEFDGKPVTDARLRAYIAQRRDGFSQDDPTWDEWDNRLTQIDFKIGEDKITLAFQQGKVGAGAVANYYKGQLSKIPKDSAFYRDVASRAAQWAKSAAGSARGSASSRISKGLESKQNGVEKTWGSYSQLEAIITDAAKRAGIIAGTQTLTDGDASRLLDLFAAGIPGPKGTTITFDDWQAASVAAYKAFDTQIAINKQLNRGTKELTTQKGKFLNQNLVRTNTIDDRAKYEAAQEQWLQEIEGAQGDPRAMAEASARYASTLGSIQANAEKDTGSSTNDPEFIGGIQNEINALGGEATGPTVTDLMSNTGEGVVTNDAEGTAEAMASVVKDIDALNDGSAFYGQSEFGGKMGVVYFPPGADLDPFGRKGLGPDTQPAIIKINGKPTQVMLKGQTITSSGLKKDGSPVDAVPDGNGNMIPVASLSPAQIASLVAGGGYEINEGEAVGYVFQNGDKRTYGVLTPDGLVFTEQNPFGTGLGIGENGFTVFGGTTLNAAGNGVVNTYQAPDLSGDLSAVNSLIDESVSPADLRTLAANATTEEAANALLATADKRTKSLTAEKDYQARAQGKVAEGPNFIGTSVGFAQDAIRNALGVMKTNIPTDTGVPALSIGGGAPKLPGMLNGIPQTPKASAPPTIKSSPVIKPPKIDPEKKYQDKAQGKTPTKPPPISSSPGAGSGGAGSNKAL